MAKYNVVMKRKRAEKAEKKRAIHGDPVTAKLKKKAQPLSISGKRQRKLLKKWRREQKEALDKGLITMPDVEMAVAEGEGTSQNTKKTTKFHMKKGFRLKQRKCRGKKGKATSKLAATEATADAMVE